MLGLFISCSNIDGDGEFLEDGELAFEDSEEIVIETSEDEQIEIVDTEESLELDSSEEVEIASTSSSSDFDEEWNEDDEFSDELVERDDDVVIAEAMDDERFNDEFSDEFDEEYTEDDFEVAYSDSEFESETVSAMGSSSSESNSVAEYSNEELSLDNFEEETVTADGSMADSETVAYDQSVVNTLESGELETNVESMSGKGIAGIENAEAAVASAESYVEETVAEYVPQNEYVNSQNTCQQNPDSLDYLDFVNQIGLVSEAGTSNCDTVNICQGIPVPVRRYSNIAPSKRVSLPSISGDHNRFYYIRSCDKTPQAIAQAIFGDESQAYKLGRRLASSDLRPGKRITYRSTIDPHDTVMRNYFDENPTIVKSYRVRSGESLASIAYKVYGDARSWKEIALLNDLNNPDALEVGQKLILKYRE